MEVRIAIAWCVAASVGLGATGCDSGPCPSGSVLVDNACIAIDDQSCAEPTALYRDVDGDGFGDPSEVSAGCARAGFSETADDCDDSDPNAHPGAPEQCNGVDDDCDGVIDDDPEVLTWYRDFDGDGYGADGFETESCVQPPGYVSNAADCNDETREVSPVAPELCNEVDDDCSGLPDDGPRMECALGETVECTTECGSVGSASCTPECRVGPECVPPIEACNAVDDDCDGVTDEGLLTASVMGTVDMHQDGMTETSARLVLAQNGLFLFYFGRHRISGTLDYNVRLYVVKIGDDGRAVGTPTLIRESPAGEGTGPIHVVTVGYSAYVAIPPTEAGPELLRVSLVDLFEVTSVGRTPVGRWSWQGHCLASDGETVAWGNIYWDRLQGQAPVRADFLVSFYDNALSEGAAHGASLVRANTESLRCGLLEPRGSGNQWVASFYADGALHVQALTAQDGILDGLEVQYPSSAVTPILRWDAGGHVMVSTDGFGEGARRYAVADRFILEDSVSGFAGDASGGSLIEGGALLTTTTDGVDIRQSGDLEAFLQYLTPGRVDTVVAHEGRILTADAPPDGMVTLQELGCP
ncbi:MAG: hypothetical protein HKN10_06695 [Myxococcales bacterium]|nr:hypothetical protein [Myxococcales bacterium]